MGEDDGAWIEASLASVRNGDVSMSQRKLTSVEAHGGLDAAVEAAQAQGVHLLQLTDDHGDILIAASLHPFRALC